MFGKFTYLFYTLLFTTPLMLFLWIYFYKILNKHIRVILATTALLTVYGFFLWPLGLAWGTWAYNDEKLLEITIFGTVLEDIIWWFCISFLLTSFAIISIYKEEKNERILKRN